MNNNIPFPFAAQTEIHEEFVNYALPPLSQKIYSWLLRRCKPGVEQEFDKADFDTFCLARHRKPFSIQWFMACFKKLLDTRLVSLVRKYYGYGFKVVVYHPWQVDDWLVNNKSRNTNNSNKSWNNSKLKFKKQHSNTDYSVPSYRENKEVTAIANGSIKDRVTNREQNIAAQKKGTQLKQSVKPPVLKSPTRADKSAPSVNVPKQELTAKKSNFKQYSNENKQIDPRDTFSSKADVDLFDNFLDKLDDLGVRINLTVKNYLAKYIKRKDARRIEAALNLLRIRKRDGAIAEPAAYFIQVLKENYAGQKKIEADSVGSDENSQARFNHWFELAREVGCCSGYEIVDDRIIVDMRGTKESWESAFNRGYNFEYFKKMMRQD